jgi:hypothetical protein
VLNNPVTSISLIRPATAVVLPLIGPKLLALCSSAFLAMDRSKLYVKDPLCDGSRTILAPVNAVMSSGRANVKLRSVEAVA